MSLILDALKKADAERHANQASGMLQTTPMDRVVAPHVTSYLPPQQSLFKALFFWVLALIFLGAAAWKIGSGKAPSSPAASTILVAPLIPATSLSQALPQTPEVVAISQIPVPPPVSENLLTTASKPTAIKSMAPSSAASTPNGSAPNIALPAKSSPSQVMTLAQLPQHIQGEMPPLAISGSIYASESKDRMLLVGKQMVREGQEIAPGLVLQHVLPKSAVLQYKGYVFKVNN